MRKLQISLVRRCDFSADIDVLPLDTGGFEIPYDGYVPKLSPLTAEPIEESIALNLIGNADEIVAMDDLLDQKETECAWAPDAAERYQVWLRAGQLQAMIGSLRKEAGSAPDFPTTDGMESGRQLGYRRAPFETLAPLVYSYTGLSSLGGKQISYSGTAYVFEVLGNAGAGVFIHTVDNHPASPFNCILYYIADGTEYTATADSTTGAFTGTGLTNSSINFFTGLVTVNGADAGQQIALSYYYLVSSALPGKLPGRLGKIHIHPTAGSGALSEYWWGLKSTKNGDPTTFTSPWDLQGISSIQMSADTTLATDAPHSRFVCDFGSYTTMVSRFWAYMEDITVAPHTTDLRGTYRILVRMCVSPGFTVRVQLYNGAASSAYVYGNPVTVTNTSYYLFDLGVVTFPAGGSGITTVAEALTLSTVGLSAEYVAGTIADQTGLLVDTRFVAIPVDEGCGHFSAAQGGICTIRVDALGRVSATEAVSGAPSDFILDTRGVTDKNCVIPVGDFVIVVAAQRAASSVTTDLVDADFFVYPRWRMPR